MREPAGTTTLDNGAIRYDCCGETGLTPDIVDVEDDHGNLVKEQYFCPHCGAYQGERDVGPDVGPEASKRAFEEARDA